MTTAPRHAIATVTSDGFIAGTLVVLDSFRRTNPWFAGDLIVLHDGLSESSATQLKRLFPEAMLKSASEDLSERLDVLVAARPELAGRRARFLSLDAFGIEGYDRLLFCDSDMVFQGDFAPLFEQGAALIACPDGATLRGTARDAASFAERPADGGAAPAQTFNAGMMLVRGDLLGPETRSALLAKLVPETWAGIATDHTDQLILNRHFDGQATLVSPAYNLLLGHRADSFAREPVRIADARLLHFNGAAKPWNAAAAVAPALRDAAMIDALRRWYDAYLGALRRCHLAGARG